MDREQIPSDSCDLSEPIRGSESQSGSPPGPLPKSCNLSEPLIGLERFAPQSDESDVLKNSIRSNQLDQAKNYTLNIQTDLDNMISLVSSVLKFPQKCPTFLSI